jgi:hypothetical protein
MNKISVQSKSRPNKRGDVCILWHEREEERTDRSVSLPTPTRQPRTVIVVNFEYPGPSQVQILDPHVTDLKLMKN